jgi:paired amphipathic helix protein Sin3a
LYSRLSSCKEEGRKYVRQKFQHLVAISIAVELGMDDPQGPSSVQEQILRDRGAEESEEALYQYMLEVCEKLFMNEQPHYAHMSVTDESAIKMHVI